MQGSWPALAEFYGLHPEDVSKYSVAEWGFYMDALEEKAEQQRQAEQVG